MSAHLQTMASLGRRLRGPQAPHRARELVRALLADQPEDVVEVAVLLTSELVANAVTHAQGTAQVRMSASARSGRLRVYVADDDRALPILKHPSLEGDSGRGIEIVDHLASRWGVECSASEDGKSVWFELRLPSGSASDGSHRSGRGADHRPPHRRAG